MTAALPRPTLSDAHLRGSLLVLATGVVFSFGGLAFRAVEAATVWEYLTFRGVGALLVGTGWLASRGPAHVRRVVGTVQPMHLAAGVMIGGISCLFIVAIEVSTVAFVLFLQTLAPVTAAWFSWWLLRERISRNVAVATVWSMIGVGVMVSGTLAEGVRPGGLVALIIPVVFGLYTTLVRSAPTLEVAVPVVMSGATMFVVGVGVTLAAGGFAMPAADAAVGTFAGAALLGAPLIVFNHAQKSVPASETTLLLLSEVVLAPVWVWLFVAEQPGLATIVGGSVILAAIAWLTVVRAPRSGRVASSRG